VTVDDDSYERKLPKYARKSSHIKENSDVLWNVSDECNQINSIFLRIG
jgi:hypothetical protein